METVTQLIAAIAVLAIAAAFIWLVSGATRQMRAMGKAAEDLSHFLKVTEDEIAKTAVEVRTTLKDTDRLISTASDTVERVDNVVVEAERLLELAQAVSAATKAIRTSTVGLSSVYEGVKQGIRALYGHPESEKGGTQNEQ